MKILLLLIISSFYSLNVIGQPKNVVVTDLIRIAETYRIADELQATIWPGLEEILFPVLLVTHDEEFLIGFERIPDGFKSEGYSTILQKEVLSRSKQFDSNLLATFPAFGMPPVVVVGRAEATNKTSEEWMLTILHEHFHQYQMADPEYYSAIEELELSKGDETGMWMLNYPFPYESEKIGNTFDSISKQLANLLSKQVTTSEYQQFWQSYVNFLDLLDEEDRRYLSFQIWQEGVARYVELRFAELAAEIYTPSVEFYTLQDKKSFSNTAKNLRSNILTDLKNPNLELKERTSFYSFGSGLALLLDQKGESWKDLYMKEKFFIERYVDVK